MYLWLTRLLLKASTLKLGGYMPSADSGRFSSTSSLTSIFSHFSVFSTLQSSERLFALAQLIAGVIRRHR